MEQGRRKSVSKSAKSKAMWTGWPLIVVLVILGILGVLGTVAFGLELATMETLDTHRYPFSLSGFNVPAFFGDIFQHGEGHVSIDLSERRLRVSLTYSGSIFAPTDFRIYGPLSVTNPLFAPAYIPTDGSSFNVPVTTTGTVDATLYLSDSVLRALVDNPELYYVQFGNTLFPGTAARGTFLGQSFKSHSP
jgi:hypothetical protein